MIYRSLLRPILFCLPPETVHELALHALPFLSSPINFLTKSDVAPLGELNRFGLKFRNPVGLAAGFDKNGTVAHALAALGFGFVEVGTVTKEAQLGNPRPRLFRLPQDRALINRLGFNNCSAAELARNIRQHRPKCVLGVNIGKSRNTPIEEAIPDYVASLDAVYDVADYIAINVSSPNTPNLRELQQPKLLAELINALQQRAKQLAQRGALDPPKPLLLKIAPDLNESEIEAVIEVALQENIAGVIATNTTVSRENLTIPASTRQSYGQGGLSGAPLQKRSNEVISFIYQLTHGRLPIIGVGGIFNANDAWEKIACGAALVQLYTGFVYEGPRIAQRINEGLAEILQREGWNSLDDAIGWKWK